MNKLRLDEIGVKAMDPVPYLMRCYIFKSMKNMGSSTFLLSKF